MSPPSRELGVSRTVTALSRAVSIVSTSNAGKAPQLPGSSACSRGCTHGKGDCRKCGFGGRGRTTIPAAAACSFSAFSHSYLSPKRYAPADGQTVNLGIIFGFFSPCAPHLWNGWYCGTGKVSSARSVRFREGAFAPFLDLKTNCIFFVRCIVFIVQIAYNDSASRKGMISWLELQQTSASEWTAT